MKQLIFCLCIIFTAPTVKSQIKEISGDTAIFWYKYYNNLYKKTDLQNFIDSKDDFNFRFCNQGQIVNIWKMNNSIQGSIINYTFKHKAKNKGIQDTIFTKSAIDSKTISKAFELIIRSGILEIKSDDEIEGWRQGKDGETYIIEYSDRQKYSFKTYWTPSIQDPIKEALLVNSFTKEFSDLLYLRNSSDDFMENLSRKNGCYSRGGMIKTCYIVNNYNLGYSGSVNLPLGYTAAAYLSHIGNLQTDVGLYITHQFGEQNSYDFSAKIGKAHIFLRNRNKTNDYLSYRYRQGKLHYINNMKFRSHRILYGINLKSINVAIGYDNLNEDSRKNGCFFSMSKNLNHIGLNIYGESSVFNNRMDYKVGTSKHLNIRSNILSSGVNVELYYENFHHHSNVGTSLVFNL